jgi:hypothetical protein
MPKMQGGYENGSSRCRFDGRFEVQKLPRVYRCDLTRTDWNLPADISEETISKLNRSIVTCINTGIEQVEVERMMAITVGSLGLADADRASVLSVIERLLRVVFG